MALLVTGLCQFKFFFCEMVFFILKWAGLGRGSFSWLALSNLDWSFSDIQYVLETQINMFKKPAVINYRGYCSILFIFLESL